MPKELRVHGVSGTPPTELLYTDPATYDQGWDLAKVCERSRDDWDVKAYWRGSDAVGGQVVSELGSRNWEVTTGSGHSRYELTPEFCSARLATVSGDLDRPGDPDLGNCWQRRR